MTQPTTTRPTPATPVARHSAACYQSGRSALPLPASSGTLVASAIQSPQPAPATPVTPVKTNNVPPSSGAGMTTAEIMNILHRLDSGAVAAAGAAHTSLGDVLAAMAASLTRHAQTLAQNWTGTAARTAMTRFQQLHDQTSALATQAAQTGSVLTWLGTQVLPKFQQLQTPGTGSAVAADAAAGGLAGEVVAGLAGAMCRHRRGRPRRPPHRCR